MTDYFALLDQPRAPWLDPEQLKQTFHARTLQSHPDAQSGRPNGEFTQVNEAYQVLRDPKRRLQHLLSLAGESTTQNSAAIPAEIEELFPKVARLTRQAEEVIARSRAATTALGLSLVRPQLRQTQQAIAALLQELQHLFEMANDQLRSLPSSNVTAQLHDLYLRFSYLTRWIAELEEKQLELSI